MPLFPSAALISSSSSSKTKNNGETKEGPQSTTDSWLNIGSSYQQPLVGDTPVLNPHHSLLYPGANSIRREVPSKKKRKHKKEQRTRSDKEHKKKKEKHSKKKNQRSAQEVTKDVINDDDDRDYSSSDRSSDDEPLPSSSSSSATNAAAAIHNDRDRRSTIQQQVVVHGQQSAPAALPRDVFFLPDGRILLTAPKPTVVNIAQNTELYRIDRRADKDLLTFGHYRLDIPNYVLSTDRGIRPLAQLVKHAHQLPRYVRMFSVLSLS